MNQHDIVSQIYEAIRQSPNSDLDEIVLACSDFTWNQVFLELDRMSRLGQVVLKQEGPGHYRVAPGSALQVWHTHISQGGICHVCIDKMATVGPLEPVEGIGRDGKTADKRVRPIPERRSHG